MIFRSGVFSRKKGLDDKTFAAHWKEIHGALASRMPGLHRYLQNHIDQRLFERQPFPAHPIDGISQLWFDDIEAMVRAEDSPEYAEAKLDIPRFQGEITILVLDSVTVWNTGPTQPPPLATQPATKLFWYATARHPVSADALRDQWRAQELDLGAGPIRFAQSVVIDRGHPVSAGVPQGELPADTFGEIWFADSNALRVWHQSAVGRRCIGDNPLLEPLAVYAGHEVLVV
jgi:uncharacterized protein (TIGR02118 family)